MTGAIYVLGALAVVVFFIVRQRRSDRFSDRSLLFPVGLGIYGLILLVDTSEHHALSIASAVLLVLSALASIGFGVIRGRTIELCRTKRGSCGNEPRGPRSVWVGVASSSLESC